MSKIAVVTGGTRGIGAGISRLLHDQGYRVAAVYARNDQVASDFSEDTGIAVFKADVSSFNDCHEVVRMIESDLGGDIEVLVNNAGITRDTTMHKMDVEQWEEVVQTNLNSCFNMTRAVIGKMRQIQYGRIINITSVNGLCGQYGQTNYSAAKAGMIGFTKASALENAKFGITINAVAPGYVKTEMVAAVPDKVLDKIVAGIPVGRLAEVEEIARCVSFLADETSSFITGTTLSVNGGQYMH